MVEHTHTIPPSKAQAPIQGERFDHLILKLLKNNKGVFIGEYHGYPAVRQSIIHLMPLFNANGVRTISFELPQDAIDELRKIPNRETLATYDSKRYGGTLSGSIYVWELLKAAEKYHIRILGHEHPDEGDKIATVVSEFRKIMDDKKLTVDEQIAKLQQKAKILRSEKLDMVKRDDYAAAYIKKNAAGKYLVIGGLGHSGNYSAGDKSTEERSFKINMDKWHALAATGYKGLNVKLGIPAIDYDIMRTIKEAGATLKGDGKASDYDVRLPNDIYENPDYPWLPPNKHLPKKETLLHRILSK